MEKVLFTEEQRFTQWWLWVILILAVLSVFIPFAVGIYTQEVLDKPFGENPMSTEGLFVTGIFSVVFMGFIFFIMMRSKLKTKITTHGIYFSYPPIFSKWKKIVPDEIHNYNIRKYRAGWEYGGYGMKKRRKYGQAYIVSGNIGLQLYLKNGKKVLIGTQRKQALEFAMEKLMNK